MSNILTNSRQNRRYEVLYHWFYNRVHHLSHYTVKLVDYLINAYLH